MPYLRVSGRLDALSEGVWAAQMPYLRVSGRPDALSGRLGGCLRASQTPPDRAYRPIYASQTPI